MYLNFIVSRFHPPERLIFSRKIIAARNNSYKRSRSRSRSDDKGMKSGGKDKKDEEDSEKNQDKKTEEDEALEYANMAEGQVVVEEVAGDDDDDMDQENGHMDDKSDLNKSGDQDDQAKSIADETAEKHDEDKGEEGEKTSEDHGKSPNSRALLKLHCPYCDVRCISFRVSSNS